MNRAFTLMEVIISTALMSIIMGSAYLCLNAAVSSQKLIEPRAAAFQNARVAMALISADLRAACPLSGDSEFLGMHRMMGSVPADNLDFATHNYTPRRPGEGDYCQESFFLDRDPESAAYVLYRRRNPMIALDPLAGGTREEIARDVLGLKFEYYDGYDWYENWGEVDRRSRDRTSRRERYNLEGLPQAVRITLWLDSNPKKPSTDASSQTAAAPPPIELTNTVPLVFQTVARLNLANAAADNSSGPSDSSGGTTQPQPNSGGNR